MPLYTYYFFVFLFLLLIVTIGMALYNFRVIEDYDNLLELVFFLILNLSFLIFIPIAGRYTDKEIYSVDDYDTAKIAEDYKAETQVYSYLYKVFMYDVEIGDVVHITHELADSDQDQWIYIVEPKDKEQPDIEQPDMEKYKL